MNENTFEYCQNFATGATEPQFAVLLKGPWGCGKSHFVRQLLSRLPDSYTKSAVLVVSLYGVGSPGEIDQILFQQIHPVLSSRGMKVAGAFARSLLRMGVSIGLGGPDGPELTAEGPGDLAKAKFNIHELEKKILVVDDLDRCSLEPTVILGYFSEFVLELGVRTFFVCNIDEYQKLHPGIVQSFQSVKDKVIGAEFQIEPDSASAVESFVAEFSFKYRAEIAKVSREVFTNLRSLNLRVLRHALYNLRQVLEAFADVADKAYVLEIAEVFLVLFIQKSAHTDGLMAEEFKTAAMIYKEYRIPITDYRGEGQKKYPIRFMSIHIPLVDLWESMIWEGLYSKRSIRECYRNELAVKKPKMETEERLVFYMLNSFREIGEAEFKIKYPQLMAEAKNGGFRHPGEYVLLANLLCLYSHAGVIKDTMDEVVVLVKAIVIANKAILRPVGDWDSMSHGYGGWGFSFEIPQVVEVLDFLETENEDVCKQQIEHDIGIMLDDLPKNSERLVLAIKASRDFEYFYGRGIFSGIDKQRAVDAFLLLDHPIQEQVLTELAEKYLREQRKVQSGAFHQDKIVIEALRDRLAQLTADMRNNPSLLKTKSLLSKAEEILKRI